MNLSLVKIEKPSTQRSRRLSVCLLEEAQSQLSATGPAQDSSHGCLTGGQVCYRLVAVPEHLGDGPGDGL